MTDPRSSDGPTTTARCGSHSTTARAHGDHLVREVHPGLEQLLVDQDRAPALRGDHQGDRHEVGGKCGPWTVAESRDLISEVRLNLERLIGWDMQLPVAQRAANPQLLESDPQRIEVPAIRPVRSPGRIR